MANIQQFGPHPRIAEKLTKILEQIPEYEQEQIADRLAAWLQQDDAEWEAAFAESRPKLEKLRNEAVKAHISGETEPLDPEKL